jgi:uncharacterized protein YecE (DUF72 family)
MAKAKSIYIGTSGWHYKHWRRRFYPEDLHYNHFLDYYARQFHTAEINNSFYKMPEEGTFIKWKETTPENFIFTAKASRYITHMKKLKDAEKPVNNFLEKLSVLGDKLGPVLFQLPPKWKVNAERLKTFIDSITDKYRYAFEFRDPSWFNDEIYAELSAKNAAFCIYNLEGIQSPLSVTADFIYIRLHGPDGAYQGSYDDKALSDWAKNISDWNEQGKDIFCYFDNDEKGFAPQNALKLKSMLNL